MCPQICVRSLLQPSDAQDGLSSVLLRKVAHVVRALDWVNGHTAKPSGGVSAARGIPQPQGTLNMLHYDSHTLQHTSNGLQAAVKLCVSRVCDTLTDIEGAEAWFRLPKV